jgi:hypothetical protein
MVLASGEGFLLHSNMEEGIASWEKSKWTRGSSLSKQRHSCNSPLLYEWISPLMRAESHDPITSQRCMNWGPTEFPTYQLLGHFQAITSMLLENMRCFFRNLGFWHMNWKLGEKFSSQVIQLHCSVLRAYLAFPVLHSDLQVKILLIHLLYLS